MTRQTAGLITTVRIARKSKSHQQRTKRDVKVEYGVYCDYKKGSRGEKVIFKPRYLKGKRAPKRYK
jgi:hypothetical protein